MHFGAGCGLVVILLLANTSHAEDDNGETLPGEQLRALLEEEQELLAEYNAAEDSQIKTVKKQERIAERVRSELLRLYDKSGGQLSEEGLLLLGDLSRAIKPQDAARMKKDEYEAVMNKATSFYEDAYEKHKSVEGYFKLAQCAQDLGMWEGTVGNETGRDDLLEHAASMFVIAASKGHSLAYKELASMCVRNLGFREEGCPPAMRQEAFNFYEAMAKEEPQNPVWSGKLAVLRASGFGQDRPDLPTACLWAANASEANNALLREKEFQEERKLEPMEYEAAGYDLNNFILHGNCQYFHNFQHPGDARDRKLGRETLQHGLELKMSLLSDDDTEGRSRLKDSLLTMIGPEVEPTHAGIIEWAADIDDLGAKWYVYVWASEGSGRGFFWSESLRMGDTALKVTKKAGNLFNFACESPIFLLEADGFFLPVGLSPAYLQGKARHQSSRGSEIEGNFTFTVVPQGPKAEL